MEKTSRILITGAVGQIGSELTVALREKYGNENVIAGWKQKFGLSEMTKDMLLNLGKELGKRQGAIPVYVSQYIPKKTRCFQ